MHKQREEDRISGALKKPSAEAEFDSRVRESEVSLRGPETVDQLSSLKQQTTRRQGSSSVCRLSFPLAPAVWKRRFPQKGFQAAVVEVLLDFVVLFLPTSLSDFPAKLGRFTRHGIKNYVVMWKGVSSLH